MSCCIIKKEVNSSIKSLDELKKHFDSVELEYLEKYIQLTLKDKTENKDIKWSVWLQVKISYAGKNTHSGKSDNEKIEGACQSIANWVDILKNFDKSNVGKQLSLFASNDEIELEEEPPSPQNGEDSSWGTYFNRRAKVRRNNLMKQYSFFELCDLQYAWWSYRENSFAHLLPKDDKEMIQFAKNAIVLGTASDKGHGRFSNFWWDNEYQYIKEGDCLSDIELIDRVKSLIRLHLVPYQRAKHVYTDDSFSASVHEESIEYEYWFDGRKINGSSWLDTSTLEKSEYELYDLEFVSWLRDYFNIKYKDVISDDDVLKENIKHFFQSMLWYGKDGYDFEARINTFRSWKEFKADINSYMKSKNIDCNGGGSGYSIDGFSGSYGLDRKGHIKITQDIEQRVSLNRDVEGLEIDSYYDNKVIVFDIKGDEIYKKAYELLNKSAAVQTSLFDFLAA